VLIIRRINLYQYIIWYNTVTHQSVLYQMMYWYKLILLMMSTCCSKHVEAWNKYVDKECVKLIINQNLLPFRISSSIRDVFLGSQNYHQTELTLFHKFTSRQSSDQENRIKILVFVVVVRCIPSRNVMLNMSKITINHKIIGKEMDLYEIKFLMVTSNSISMLPTHFLGKIETTLASMRYLSHSFVKAQQSSDWNGLVSSRDKTFR
jgi:hypothetical protein